ncbi:hypothetical protein [Sporosarcina sp. P29]|uniref:hypothetical protein n=1 Tax=Sporosarcina sp. P29 TaxID=2048252 RepID=UPI000C1628CB|nr:hypothetical protein [Sporosarcina sp. P29]PIC97816.1 hypothetical protein CSV68_16475 [Sporosarcina sp. P29]
MDKLKRFDDVTADESISDEHFVFYLEQGREIEFVYQKQEYFISHSLEGRAMWIGQKRVSEYFNDLNQYIIDYVKIDGITLADLIKRKEIKITTVF